MRNYPFDRQVFRIPIVSEYSEEDVVLLPDPEEPSFMAETFTVADWDIKNFGVRSIESQVNRYDLSSRFEIYFEAVRRSEFIILTFIIPLALIVGMSWIVFWIDPREIRSQFSVSVTTVLTLIAYYITLTSRLPEIPYLTRMDYLCFRVNHHRFRELVGGRGNITPCRNRPAEHRPQDRCQMSLAVSAYFCPCCLFFVSFLIIRI